MRKEIKCTNCGSKKLKRASFSFCDCGDKSLPISVYVCEECGHIEMFENEKAPVKKQKEVM